MKTQADQNRETISQQSRSLADEIRQLLRLSSVSSWHAHLVTCHFRFSVWSGQWSGDGGEGSTPVVMSQTCVIVALVCDKHYLGGGAILIASVFIDIRFV